MAKMELVVRACLVLDTRSRRTIYIIHEENHFFVYWLSGYCTGYMRDTLVACVLILSTKVLQLR